MIKMHLNIMWLKIKMERTEESDFLFSLSNDICNFLFIFHNMTSNALLLGKLSPEAALPNLWEQLYFTRISTVSSLDVNISIQ